MRHFKISYINIKFMDLKRAKILSARSISISNLGHTPCENYIYKLQNSTERLLALSRPLDVLHHNFFVFVDCRVHFLAKLSIIAKSKNSVMTHGLKNEFSLF